MSYAKERQWSYAQKAIVLTQYILAHGHITFAMAKRITGGNRFQVRRLLLEMDGVLATMEEGSGRVLLK